MAQSQSMSASVVGYLDQVEVPAIKITPTDGGSVIDQANSTFISEFNLSSDITGDRISHLACDDNSPINRTSYHRPSNAPNVEVDLISMDEDSASTYLRHRLWESDCLVEFYIPSVGRHPYHRHLAILHRVYRHNLRNGLNAIVGWAKIAQDADTQGEEASKAINAILTRARQLERITSEARQLEYLLNTPTTFQEINLNQIVARAVAEVKSAFSSPNISVDIPTDISVLANEKLEIAIENIVDNAVRHTPAKTEVDISAVEQDETVELLIADTGQGIPPIEKQILTENYSLDKVEHGSGLGLWIIRCVFDSHPAELDVHTKNREGSKFSITLDKM